MYATGKTDIIKKKTRQLADFAVSILRVNPSAVSVNRFKEPPLPLPGHNNIKLTKLFKMLVHASTLINETYRVKDKNGRYMSQKEDYVNALKLMKDLVLYFDTRKGTYDHEILAILETIQENKGEITNRHMQEFTGYSKSHCSKTINLYLDRGWITRKGGNQKQGYTYILATNG